MTFPQAIVSATGATGCVVALIARRAGSVPTLAGGLFAAAVSLLIVAVWVA